MKKVLAVGTYIICNERSVNVCV